MTFPGDTRNTNTFVSVKHSFAIELEENNYDKACNHQEKSMLKKEREKRENEKDTTGLKKKKCVEISQKMESYDVKELKKKY